MVATIESPTVATLAPSPGDLADLCRGLHKLCKLPPQGCELAFSKVRKPHGLIPPQLTSRSPSEIGEYMMREPAAAYLCDIELAVRGVPQSAYWGVCFSSRFLHVRSEADLRTKMLAAAMTTWIAVERNAYGYRPFHMRCGSTLYSLFVKDVNTRVSLAVASLAVDRLARTVEDTLKIDFLPESTLDAEIEAIFRGGDPPPKESWVAVESVPCFDSLGGRVTTMCRSKT